jgi:GNAT superfamily N-acetyltransferase
MFFYRYIPRSAHLHKYEAEMHSRFLAGKCEHVQGNIYKFFERADGDWVYFVVDEVAARETEPKASRLPSKAILGFCSLTKIPRWISFEVSMLYVNPDLRGKGVSMQLYDAILNDGVVLVSGKMQNIGARRLWVKLASNPAYVVWAHDIMNLKRFDTVTVEENELDCSLKIYNDLSMRRRKQTEDIRLIAVKA